MTILPSEWNQNQTTSHQIHSHQAGQIHHHLLPGPPAKPPHSALDRSVPQEAARGRGFPLTAVHVHSQLRTLHGSELTFPVKAKSPPWFIRSHTVWVPLPALYPHRAPSPLCSPCLSRTALLTCTPSSPTPGPPHWLFVRRTAIPHTSPWGTTQASPLREAFRPPHPV